jgi:hypothetical protein
MSLSWIRWLGVACVAWGLFAARSAHAGFFVRDRYDPPMPHFLTPTFDGGVLFGGWRSTEVGPDPVSGLAWNATVGGRLLVLPMVKGGVRAGFGPYRGFSDEGRGTAVSGFRQSTTFVDATAELATPILRVYGFYSLAGGGKVRGPKETFAGRGDTELLEGRPESSSVAASYRHAGIGLIPRWMPLGKPGSSEKAQGTGFLIEVRRTWMETDEPSFVAPNQAAGWMVLTSVSVDFLLRNQ